MWVLFREQAAAGVKNNINLLPSQLPLELLQIMDPAREQARLRGVSDLQAQNYYGGAAEIQR